VLVLKQLELKLLCGGLQTSEHRFGDGVWKVSGQLGLHLSNHNWSLGDQRVEDGLDIA
jgi:hypothetical protein